MDGASGVMKVGGKGSSTPLTGMLCKVGLKIMVEKVRILAGGGGVGEKKV